ncbi:Copia protein [Gossypium australe]|uniref:Copia protein n=1 Tax=Gossypium australe TaxID=47621 RepID=A0A5B6W8L8_9ROSI|nr:Copia protein [Gossypium australe]
MHQPRHGHWLVALRVLKYLKLGIFLPSNCNIQLHAYCDLDWAGCPLSHHSLTSYFILLGSSLISWKTKKQTVVSRLSAEVEYRSMATTTCEIIWLYALLHDLTISVSFLNHLYYDNCVTLHIVANPVHYECTKHIEVDCHFIRDWIKTDSITTSHLADIFTKALGSSQLFFLVGKLGIRNLHAPTGAY